MLCWFRFYCFVTPICFLLPSALIVAGDDEDDWDHVRFDPISHFYGMNGEPSLAEQLAAARAKKAAKEEANRRKWDDMFTSPERVVREFGMMLDVPVENLSSMVDYVIRRYQGRRPLHSLTLLQAAAKYGEIEVVRVLLVRGVDVNEVMGEDAGGTPESALTPLALARRGGNREIEALLMTQGAAASLEEALEVEPARTETHTSPTEEDEETAADRRFRTLFNRICEEQAGSSLL